MVCRGRDLDLAGAGGLAIGLDHPPGARDPPVEERALLRLGVSPALPEQRPDRLLVPVQRIHPREMKPGLKIADLVRRERTLSGRADTALRRADPRLELAVSRVRLEHPRLVHAEEMPRQETLLLRGQRLRGFSREIE